jgi:hypothetical protein
MRIQAGLPLPAAPRPRCTARCGTPGEGVGALRVEHIVMSVCLLDMPEQLEPLELLLLRRGLGGEFYGLG